MIRQVVGVIRLYTDEFARHVDRYSMSVVAAFALILLATWLIERYRRRRKKLGGSVLHYVSTRRKV